MSPAEIDQYVNADFYRYNIEGERMAHFNAILISRLAQSKKAARIKASDMWSTVGGEHKSERHRRLNDPKVVDLDERRRMMSAFKARPPKPRAPKK